MSKSGNTISIHVKKQINPIVYRYIIDSINGESYGVELENDSDKLKFLAETINSEYGYNLARYNGNEGRTICEWLLGLPSVLSIEYTYHNIALLLQSWGLSDSLDSDYQKGNYWMRIANVIRIECRKAGIVIFK